MSTLVPKSHNFEVAKNRLKDFSKKTSDDLKISTVKTDGGFLGLENHKVTGYELNSRLSVIQEHLIYLNNLSNKTIKEFGEVYNALDALDKEYIQGIVTAIKANEITSKSIQEAHEKISMIVDDQKRALEVLKKFKQKVDGYTHLKDIDKLWDSSEALIYEMNNLSNDLKQQSLKLEAIISFISKLEKIDHLQDIDIMWNSLLNIHKSLSNIFNEINSFKDTVYKQQGDIEKLLSSIEDLQEHKKDLDEIKHLNDVDSIWEQTAAYSVAIEELKEQNSNILELVQANKMSMDELKDYKAKLSNIKHLSDVDEIWNSSKFHSSQLSELKKQSDETRSIIQSNKEKNDAVIASVVEKNDTAINMLNRKMKYAYLLAGGSLGLAIVELIVILLKVI